MRYTLSILINYLLTISSYSQAIDTIDITPQNINVKNLMMGKHQYLVYYQDNIDGNKTGFEFWTRNVAIKDDGKRKVIEIAQYWENNDSIFHEAISRNDIATFKPIYQRSWWKKKNVVFTNEFDFEKQLALVRGKPLGQDTASVSKATLHAFKEANEVYCLNWHLDLEVFSILPLKDNTAYRINFYDPGFRNPPQKVVYTIEGSAKLKAYDNYEVDCWLLKYIGERHQEVFWISKKTHEVVKLEQQFDGKFRYKIKL